jgi:hypothetical protein
LISRPDVAPPSQAVRTSAGDVRVERVIAAAAGSEQLEAVLRAAWHLMSVEQRNELMVAAPTVSVLQAGDDYVEVVELRASLVHAAGLQRVVLQVTRDGSGTGPQITSLRAFDAFDADKEVDIDHLPTSSQLAQLAMRLDDELLQAMPPQFVAPAWVSTIDWDLAQDVLVREVHLDDVDRRFVPARWTSASERLDNHELPDCVDPWQEQWRIVVALRPALGDAMPGWAEVTLSSSMLSGLRDDAAIARHLDRHVELAFPLPGESVRAGAAATGKNESTEFRQAELVVSNVFGQGACLGLRGLNAEGWPQSGGRTPLQTFVEWVDATRPGDPVFVAESGELLDAEVARHLVWVDEYHRSRGPALADEQTEFEVERPHV